MSTPAALLAALKADVAMVQKYATAASARRRGRPLLVAFAALQRMEETARALYALGRRVPAALTVADDTARHIRADMGRVAAKVAALSSLSRARDLPALRDALEIAGTPTNDRATERAAVLARAATVAMGRQRHGVGPAYESLQALFRAVGEAHGCSAPTVRRAWLAAGGEHSQFVAKPHSAPPPPPDAQRARGPDRTKVKAAIDRVLRKKV